jgi:hypothetical protein
MKVLVLESMRAASCPEETMPRKAKVPAITPSQARYILEKLIDDGKVSAADVRQKLAGMWGEMSFVERRLAEIRGFASDIDPVRAVKKAAKQVKKVVARARRKMKVSPQRAASMKLQGRYLSLIARVAKKDRARYQKMAKAQGREKAIAAMEKATK